MALRGKPSHGAQYGDAAGEILAANVPGGGQQSVASLAACESVAQAAEEVAIAGVRPSDNVDLRRDAAAQDAAIIARQNAGDGVQMPVQFERASNHMDIAAQPPAPETVADYDDGAAFIGLRIEAAGRGANAEDVKEIGARGHLPGDFAVRAGIPGNIAESEVESQILKYACLAELAIPGIRSPIGNAHQTVRLAGAEVVQNHLADDAVNCDVGAQAQSQRTNRDSGERRRSAEPSQSVPKIAK